MTDGLRKNNPWLVIGALLFVAGASSVPFIVPSISKAVTASNIGNELGLCGIIWALGGFAVTAWQLIRSQTASEAAANAIDNLKLRLRAFEDQQLCHSCLALCGEIERLHALAAQSRTFTAGLFLPDRYRTLRLSLIELKHRITNDTALDPGSEQLFQSAISKLGDTEKHVINKMRNPNRVAPNLNPLQTAIQSLSELLTTLSFDLDKLVIGESDAKR